MPLSDCEVQDPRIRRTRKALQAALRDLMKAKRFDEISVQDIAAAAAINRATFYDHYTDKFALLDAMVAGGFHALLEERRVVYDGTCPSAAQALILATCDYLAASCTGRRDAAVEPRVGVAVSGAIRRVLQAGITQEASAELPSDMVAAAASWAIYGAAKQWFDTPGRPPAEEIAPVVLQLVLPVLQPPRADEEPLPPHLL